MKTYGLELEYFIKKNDQYVPTHKDMPADSCRYLAEARGDKHEKPREAVHLLIAQMSRLGQQAAKLGYQLELAATAAVDKELLRLIRRRYGKNSAKSYFAHGGCYKNTNPRAGLHIHFGDVSKQRVYHSSTSASSELTTINQLNIPRIIWLLDEAFKDEIKAAKRVKGEYELKPYGFEYRSLPATVNLDKVISVLERIDKGVDELAIEDDGEVFAHEGDDSDHSGSE